MTEEELNVIFIAVTQAKSKLYIGIKQNKQFDRLRMYVTNREMKKVQKVTPEMIIINDVISNESYFEDGLACVLCDEAQFSDLLDLSIEVKDTNHAEIYFNNEIPSSPTKSKEPKK